MTKSFLIVISIIFIIQIFSICSFIRVCPVAKAGKVSKFYWKYKLLLGKKTSAIECGGKIVDISDYKNLYVYGNSMKDYRIRNGQQVFVKEYVSMQQKESISDFPVLVFHIYNMKYQSPYKLRKFVCYVGNPRETDWESIYHIFKSRIKIGAHEFISELSNKQAKLNNPHERHILSETFDEDSHSYHYSLHPISSLYGEVVYVV